MMFMAQSVVLVSSGYKGYHLQDDDSSWKRSGTAFFRAGELMALLE